MRKMQFVPRLAVMFTLLGAVACSDDGTGPDGQLFDPEVVLQDYDAVQLVMSSEAFGSLEGVAVGFPTVGAPSDIFDMLLGHEDAGRIAAAFAPVISEGNRGNTFVYNELEQQYIVDPERTGAPETGVRFVLYSEDATTGMPDVNDERGYFDLIDLGDNSTYDIDLQMDGVWDDNQFLSYGLQLEEMPQGGEIAVDGFLSDGIETLNFDWSLVQTSEEATQTQTTDLDYHLWMTSRNWDFVVSMDVVSDPTGENVTVGMTVQHGNRVLSIQATGDDTSISGTISINGEVFVTMSGSSDNPTFEKPDGTSLTARDIEALTRIVHFVDDAFEFFGGLMEPIGAIVFLGIIL